MIDLTIFAFPKPRARERASANCVNGFSPASPHRTHSWMDVNEMPTASAAVRSVHASQTYLHSAFVISDVHSVRRPMFGFDFIPVNAVVWVRYSVGKKSAPRTAAKALASARVAGVVVSIRAAAENERDGLTT